MLIGSPPGAPHNPEPPREVGVRRDPLSLQMTPTPTSAAPPTVTWLCQARFWLSSQTPRLSGSDDREGRPTQSAQVPRFQLRPPGSRELGQGKGEVGEGHRSDPVPGQVGAVVPACLGTGRRGRKNSERMGCWYLLSRVPSPALWPLCEKLDNKQGGGVWKCWGPL